jgi:hypothetical protein
MSIPPKEQVDSSDVGLALLGFASGSMDALAFFNLGEVFPSAMTGNTALLGLALGQGHVIAASRPFIAFVGFLTGAAAASVSVDLWLDKLPAPRAVCWLLALEACFLAAFALAWAVPRLADRRRRSLWPHRRRLFGNGDPERCGAVGRSVRDHDRRVHEHPDLHRDRGDRGPAAAAAQAALRHEAADRDVSDLWRRRRQLRSARLVWGVDCLLAICGRGRGGGLPLARRTTERE